MDTLTSNSGLYFRWDPKNLEIRTKSVERTLEPLVTQVTSLVNHKAPSNRRKGRSRRAHVLVESVRQATENFLLRGEEIANENPEIRAEMLAAIDDVRKTGEEMYVASRDFADDPCSTTKRGSMVRAARALLSAVTRLLILADMVDVHLLLKSLNLVKTNLEALQASSSQQELMQRWTEFGENVVGLIDLAGVRQHDLIDPRLRDEIAAARAMLKKNNTMLLTASKAYVRHPELAAARANRDFAIKSVCDAVGVISGVTQAGQNGDLNQLMFAHDGPGELAAELDEFDNQILLDPYTYDDSVVRPALESRLENIVSSAAMLADSPCTRPDHRQAIVHECNNVRQALQDLLHEYQNNAGRKTPSDRLNAAMHTILGRTEELRRVLRMSVVDHVSDIFMGASTPMQMMVDAARAGQEAQVEALSVLFQEHASKLVEVANLACTMSGNEEGVKFVRMAAGQVEQLCPQVINAARVLAARPKSKVAQENMDVFEDAWNWSVKMLTESVDDIISIADFLAVSEHHIFEDVQRCIDALRERDGDGLDRTAGAIRGRSGRVCDVVTAEMASYRANSSYVDRVMTAVVSLRDQVVPSFADKANRAVGALDSGAGVDEREVGGAAHRVYDGVKEIRRAVVLQRDTDGYESDYGQDGYSSGEEQAVQENVVEEHVARSDQTIMRMLPPEQKAVIAAEMAGFLEEKKKLMREMTKWDDSANDIIVLAKKMCMIMMQMTDFTRGKGSLKSTMDVIAAARRISDCGSQLDRLARQVADQCPDSASKRDLIAYLQRITLYCHQLNITSKVKADVQNVGGELSVSGLDSATSLIQAAKNLMTAVVQTVKASYIASTKYKGTIPGSGPVVQWRMKAPSKKPLVPKERLDDMRAQVRRSARYRPVEPIKELSQFDQPTGPIGDSEA